MFPMVQGMKDGVGRCIGRAALLSAALGTAVGMTARAQQASSAHEVQVGAMYSYVHTNLVPGCNCFGTQGGSGLFTVRLSPTVAALGEVDVTHRGGITQSGYDLTQTVFTGGFRYTPDWRHAPVRPFGDLLVGGAHAGGSLSPANTGLGGSFAFAFQTGGGVALRRGRFTVVPAQADYLLTTFQNGTGENRQNDFRLSAGVLFRIR